MPNAETEHTPATLEAACNSGMEGHSSSRIGGVHRDTTVFANGHVEELSQREVLLVGAAYRQGVAHASNRNSDTAQT